MGEKNHVHTAMGNTQNKVIINYNKQIILWKTF